MTIRVAIVSVALRRLLRDRGSWFFVFVFPLLLILLIGAQFGGDAPPARLAVSAEGILADQLVDRIDALDRVEVVRQPDPATVHAAVTDGTATAGLNVPPGYDDAVRGGGGTGIVLDFVSRPDGSAALTLQRLLPVVAEESQRIILTDFLRLLHDQGFGEALAQADAAMSVVPAIEVIRTQVGAGGTDDAFAGLGRFDLGAAQQLLLFVFLTCLASATAIVEARDLRVTQRILAHPVTPSQLVQGMAGARFAIALFQGLFIMVGTVALFGVDWGSPVASLTVLLVFAAVSAGAGMLLGALGRTAQQVSAISIGVGLVLAAMGGSMLPLEFMPARMRAIAHVTPHAWAYEAYAQIVRGDGGIADILPQLGVLTAMAAVLVTVGGRLLRRRLI